MCIMVMLHGVAKMIQAIGMYAQHQIARRMVYMAKKIILGSGLRLSLLPVAKQVNGPVLALNVIMCKKK